MARAGYMQALIAAENILSLVKGTSGLQVYKPMRWLEGSITLTLGKVCLANENCTIITYAYATRTMSYYMRMSLIEGKYSFP